MITRKAFVLRRLGVNGLGKYLPSLTLDRRNSMVSTRVS